MSGSRLSVGLVFRVVDCTKDYNFDDDTMTVYYDCTKLESEEAFAKFDEDEFNNELLQLYYKCLL